MRRGEEKKGREGSEWGRVVVSLLCRPIDKPHFSSNPRRFPLHRLEPHLFFVSLHRLLRNPLSLAYFYHFARLAHYDLCASSKPSKSTHSPHSIYAPPLDIQNVVLPTTFAIPIYQCWWRQHDHYGQLHLRRQGPLRRVHMRRLRFTCVTEAWRAYPLQELWTPRSVQAEDQ